MQAKHYFERVARAMKPLYGGGEAQAIARQAMQYVMGWPPARPVREDATPLTPVQACAGTAVLERLLRGEPLQYIVGEVEFLGLRLRIDNRALIPRPETEELAARVAAALQGAAPFRLLDIGTGSGCLAIALKKKLPQADVTALDISAGALALAEENARLNGTAVRFVRGNVLREPVAGIFDVVVSNPPYIGRHEQAAMPPHVTGHEPAEALFVEGANPLLFYERTARLACDGMLAHGGRLYFEVNALHGDAIAGVLHAAGFGRVAVSKDLSGRDRFVEGVKK